MVIAVDFDGTIVTHAYPRIGKPVPFAIETLLKMQQEGHHQLILWTVREGDLLNEAVNYCRARGLVFYAVNANYPEERPETQSSRKVSADLYIDDRSLGGLPDWGVIWQMVSSGRCFTPPTITTVSPEKSFWQRLFNR
ncbi:MAG: hypothetical protein NC038_03160 [Paludibacter sp.]|nr:hypothetical protein [Bacteroidales bacterium]MCM1069131.1 hypothetical protein [Prevotella sp.]MCM1353570.1 hypothetical protein [Bacteroides sp.]MCM1442731.1 hypothetical protein [Muribaculum sp.]MCM1481633.1 hypothetical protein [Paludibacter sp.]